VTQLQLTEKADSDLEEIWSYIASDSFAAADRVLDRIRRSINQLLDFPQSGRACPEIAANLRCATVGNYVIYYRFVTKPKTVLIVRIPHGARDPEQLDFGA
jgi:toxin ParE1/3/4